MSAPTPFHILSLTGGGYLGLFTACILAELEDRAGEPLGRRFDLIAGTSIGGILALALAYEVPMATVRDVFAKRGNEIFGAREVPRTRLERLRAAWRGLASPRYRPEPLSEIVREFLGARPLGDALHPVVVPAINLSRGETRLFRTPHNPRFASEANTRALDAAMATAAAPMFFPLAQIEGELFMDAGVYIDSPDLIALHEAEHVFGRARADIRMLSIGTMTADFRGPASTRADIGALGWLGKRRMIYTILSAQQHLTTSLAAQSLGERYLRVDRKTPDATWDVIDLDAAGPNAVRTLLELGEDSARTLIASSAVQPFLSHRAIARPDT